MGVHTLRDQGLQHIPEFVGDLETAGGGIERLVAGPARLGRGGLGSFALLIALVYAQPWFGFPERGRSFHQILGYRL